MMRTNQDMLRGSQIGNILNPRPPAYTRDHHAINRAQLKERAAEGACS